MGARDPAAAAAASDAAAAAAAGRHRVQFIAPSFEEQQARDAAARQRRPLHLRLAPRGKYAEEMERRYRDGLPRGVGIRSRAPIELGTSHLSSGTPLQNERHDRHGDVVGAVFCCCCLMVAVVAVGGAVVGRY